MKWASETPAMRASVGTSSGSAEGRSMASRARSIRRFLSSMAWLTAPEPSPAPRRGPRPRGRARQERATGTGAFEVAPSSARPYHEDVSSVVIPLDCGDLHHLVVTPDGAELRRDLAVRLSPLSRALRR